MNDAYTQTQDPRELEERANHQRSEINRTLSQIESQFSPSQMIDQAMGLFKDNGGEMANNLGRTVRDNPVPLLLTGVGLAWMAMSSQNASRSRGYPRDHYDYRDDGYARYDDHDYRSYDTRDFRDQDLYRGNRAAYPVDADDHSRGQGIGDARSAYTSDSLQSGVAGEDPNESSLMDKARHAGNEALDSMADARDKAKAMGQDALDSVADARDEAEYRYRQEAHRARHAARDWRDRAGGQMQDFRGTMRSTTEDASRFMREQPLVVGAAGIALGALIGALLPPTRVEDRLAGQRSDAITDEVERKAEDTLKQGSSAAREHVQKAAEDVKTSASEALDKAERKAESKTESNTDSRTDKTSGKTTSTA